jgi:hypothetical protein
VAAHARLVAIAALAAVCLLSVVASSWAELSPGEASLLRRDDRGVYVAFCPEGQEIAATALAASVRSAGPEQRARMALADHAGWPEDQCLKMDKGTAGESRTLVGLKNVHNWLLGGYGNDTIYGGNEGDVIWGDYQPSGQSESEIDRIHAGEGADWIYSSHGFNEIWTGGGADHIALVYGHGIIYCNGKGLKTFVMRYLAQNRPWTLVGCTDKVIDRYRA